MNPLIKETVEKISTVVNLTHDEAMHIAVIVGNAIIVSIQENDNINMRGGDDINENTIGVYKPEYDKGFSRLFNLKK